MQSLSSLSWNDLLKTLLGALIGLIPWLVQTYRNRKKSDLEEREITARTTLARVSADSVVVRDSIATGEGVSKMLASLIDAGDTIKDLQDRVFELEQENIRMRILKLSMKKAKALLDFHQIPFSDADQPEIKKLIEGSK